MGKRGQQVATIHPCYLPLRNFRAAVYDENTRVCWGPLQAHKETR